MRYGEKSRIDLFLEKGLKRCFVEIKNCTLVTDEVAYFPDAVTDRGTKHLLELRNMVRKSHRAVMLYVVQRHDCRVFRPADHIEPTYSKTLRKVHKSGVEILVYTARISPKQIVLDKRLPHQL